MPGRPYGYNDASLVAIATCRKLQEFPLSSAAKRRLTAAKCLGLSDSLTLGSGSGRLADLPGMARKDLDNVRRAAAGVARAQAKLVRAMAAARASGETLRDIGREASLSHQHVSDLLREHREAEESVNE